MIKMVILQVWCQRESTETGRSTCIKVNLGASQGPILTICKYANMGAQYLQVSLRPKTYEGGVER